MRLDGIRRGSHSFRMDGTERLERLERLMIFLALEQVRAAHELSLLYADLSETRPPSSRGDPALVALTTQMEHLAVMDRFLKMIRAEGLEEVYLKVDSRG